METTAVAARSLHSMTTRIGAGAVTGRTVAILLFGALIATEVCAQSGGTVPVTEDLRRREQVEEAIDPRVAPRSPSAPVQSDPSGVAGFNGPPGGVGDSVGSYGALPQGAAGANVR